MNTNRRTFLTQLSASALASSFLAETAATAVPFGKAEACIFLWLGGGMAQIDTFDPKRLGDPSKRVAGSAYKSIGTAVDGINVCEHLPRVADRLDRMTILRTTNHSVIDEHGAATNYVYTGRPVSGTVVYPSLGSIINHQLESAAGIPGYVLIGYPSVSRGPGFLGSRHGFVYLTDTRLGPAGLARPTWLEPDRAERRGKLLDIIRESTRQGLPQDHPIVDYDDVIGQSQALAEGSFKETFELDREPAALRETYGSEFGQRCLLARRLVQGGARFVEVLHNLNFTNGTGWDTHNEGQLKQHLLIQDVDIALSALMDDLENKQMLDKTLIVLASEFGRPAEFDAGGGRGHQGAAFSTVLAGGGLNHCGAWGETDELSKKLLTHPVSIPDFHATIHQTVGIDPHKELFDGDRPIPITDGGVPLKALFG
ncbi:MAG: hypothetical protein ACI8T1_004116 [Verrucomicrobiales bacterium]|jgi:hypothetical protein